jgi:hypothetical protein
MEGNYFIKLKEFTDKLYVGYGTSAAMVVLNKKKGVSLCLD